MPYSAKMKLTLAGKLGLFTVVTIGVVIAYSLCANLYMRSLQERVHTIVDESVPLVVATEEMDARKTAVQTELKNYLLENEPGRLPALEEKIRVLAAAHSECEIEIGKAIGKLTQDHPKAEMRKIWAEGMTTIMPGFDRETSEALAAHKNHLELYSLRIAKTEQHEEQGMRLFELLADVHSLSQNPGSVISTVASLERAHLYMMHADEEYVTKGQRATSQERLELKKRFVEYSEEFGGWLKVLQDSGDPVWNHTLASEISAAYTKFASSALGEGQLFSLYEKELAAYEKTLDHITNADALGRLDSRMAEELTALASGHLSDMQRRTTHLMKWTCAALAIVSAAAILGCWVVMNVISRRIAKPILALSDAAKAMAKGDWAGKVEVSANDEIGDLCAAFNEMAEKLRTTTTSIENLDREIHERRKAEDSLDQLNRDLEAANLKLTRTNKELQEFARIAAHDLKTPLRAIGTLADWIATDYADKFDEQGKEQVRLLVTKAKRMTAMIDDVLHYSSAGQSAQRPQAVDLNILLAEVIAEISPPEHVEVAAEKELPTIVGKRTHIIQILENLVGNAVKFMDKPRGCIRIGCVEQSDFWKFSVADNGPGINARYFEKIFEIFQTLAPRDGVESTGIGLSIVKKLVELSNGQVWVESQVGKGSTFLFTLPKQEQGTASANTCPPKTGACVMQPAKQAAWIPFL